MILAAGKGTRLRGVSGATPKVMMEISGQPLLERHIIWLRAYGIRQFYVNLHWNPDAIRSHLGDGSRYDVRITYSVEDTLQGTAGALRAFGSELDQTFFVHYGDIYSELDVEAMMKVHRATSAVGTLAVHSSSHPEDSDIVEIDQGDRVTALHHKPGDARFGSLGNAGCYLLEPQALPWIPHAGAADFFRDVFPPMLLSGNTLSAYHNRHLVTDMGTPERYAKLQALLRAREA